METDLIISAINDINKTANQALINKDADAYIAILDPAFVFTPAGGVSLNKRDYAIDLRKYFKGIKHFDTSYYRIKSSFVEGVFTEKIARKSVVVRPNLLLFSKKQTIQTEEMVHWKNVSGEWKIIAVEITLEEKY
jgi:hypothetical protein